MPRSIHADGRWRVRDLNSLNGTRVNDERLDGEWELSPSDEVHLGRTHLLFVEDMNQLPDLPTEPPPPAGEAACRSRSASARRAS